MYQVTTTYLCPSCERGDIDRIHGEKDLFKCDRCELKFYLDDCPVTEIVREREEEEVAHA